MAQMLQNALDNEPHTPQACFPGGCSKNSLHAVESKLDRMSVKILPS